MRKIYYSQKYLAYFCLILGILFLLPKISQASQESPKNLLELNIFPQHVLINMHYSGKKITLTANVLKNTQTASNAPIDLIFVVQGPERSIKLWPKIKKHGLWQNGKSLSLRNIPSFYALSSTKALTDIASPELYKSLQLGPEYINTTLTATPLYKKALFEIMQKNKNLLINPQQIREETTGKYSFSFQLPIDALDGKYTVHAYLFSAKKYLTDQKSSFEAHKSSFLTFIYKTAHQHSLLYGLFAVFMSFCIGFAGRKIMKKF